MTTEEAIDFDTLSVCRICLQNSEFEEEDSMHSIFDRDPDSNLCLYEKIEKCGGIKIISHPDLPTRICNKCRAFLAVAYKFRIICKNSDDYLSEFVVKSGRQNGRCSRGADSTVGENVDEEFGTPEYLMEYNPETGATTVAQFMQHNVDGKMEEVTTIDFAEIDNYTEMYAELMNDDDIREQDDIIEMDDPNGSNGDGGGGTESLPRTPSPPATPTHVSASPTKTLGISSDGTAVIRVKSDRQLVKERCLHVCDICGNAYPRKYVLHAHMRRHRDERPYECEICQQTFHMSCELSRHMRKHTKLRPHMCQYCKRCFTDRSSLVKHERIHRNERPYTCETCGKSFTYSSVLKVHLLTHTGEKRFSCGICRKRFARAHHLQSHLETLLHHDDPRTKTLLEQIKSQTNKNKNSYNGTYVKEEEVETENNVQYNSNDEDDVTL